jgi:biopolymer transport protein TolR
MRSRRISRPDFAAIFVIMVTMILIVAMMAPEQPRNSSVDLAKTYSPVPMPTADRKDALVLAVLRDGATFFGSERVQADDLPPKIRTSIGFHTERKVYIKADARVRYGAVKEALGGVQGASIQDIAFIVEQAKQGR